MGGVLMALRQVVKPLLLLFVFAPLASPSHAADYHVAPPPLGDDANPGTPGAPWATLQHAADTVQPGDRILVRSGSYAGAQFTTSGTAELPIELKALPGEEAARRFQTL